MEIENLDARLGRIEHTIVLVTAGHLALQAPGAFVGVDVQRLKHLRLQVAGGLDELMRTLGSVAGVLKRIARIQDEELHVAPGLRHLHLHLHHRQLVIHLHLHQLVLHRHQLCPVLG